MLFFDRISHYLNRALIFIAGIFLVAMIVLTCSDIFLRIVWKPVSGTFELMCYFSAVLTAFALGYTQLKKGHIAVDIVVLGFSKGVRRVLTGINDILCMTFFGLVAWKISKYAHNLLETGEVSETLRIAYYPFAYGVALGCAVLSLVFLTNFLKILSERKENEI